MSKFVINGGDDDESVASLMAASFMFSRTPRGVVLERALGWRPSSPSSPCDPSGTVKTLTPLMYQFLHHLTSYYSKARPGGGLKFYTQTQNVRDIIHYTRIAQIAPFEVFKHSNFMRLSSTKTKTVGVV